VSINHCKLSLFESIISRFNLSNNKIKVFKNIFWAILGKAVNILGSLLVGILVARYLGPESFGLMNYVISYVTLFTIISNFGLDNIEIRELSRNPDEKNVILGTAFLLRIMFAVIAVILVIITLIVFESDGLTIILVLIYTASLIFGAFNVIRNYFTSIVLNEYIVKTEISRTIIGVVIKVLLLYFEAPLLWFIVAITFDYFLISTGYFIVYNNKIGRISEWFFDKRTANFLVKESIPMLLSGGAVILYQKIDMVIIGNLIDNSAVGQFSVANRFADFAIFIPIIIAQTITPILVNLHKIDNEKYKAKRKEFLDIMVWGGVCMAVGIFILANPAINILFGEQYASAIPVLQIISFKVVFFSLFNASGQIIIIEGLQKIVVLRNIIGCLVNISLNLYLIPKFGIIGAAWSAVITYAFSGYFSHLFIRPYNFIFKLQSESILFGWRVIFEAKNLLKK
jgi:O-antigen/teichoic acid export membrane protein